jgi:thiopeptide-type bacteriocin biosynthesis protein
MIKFGNYFLLRTPISSLNFFFELQYQRREDRIAFNQKIKNYFLKPEINEGLFLSSSTLFKNLHSWNNPPNDSEISKLDISYFKYLLRSVYRCTPFGTFAGISTGTISTSQTEFLISNCVKRRIKLDIGFLCDLVSILLKDSELVKTLMVYTNDTIYQIGNEYRYTNYLFHDESKIFSLNSIEHTAILETAIEKARTGIRFNDLASQLSDSKDDSKEAVDFIEKLLEMQILITELEPSVHGGHFQERISEVIKRVDQNSIDSQKLISAIKLTFDLAQSPNTDKYNQINEELSVFGLNRDLSRSFHVDIHRRPDRLNINENDLEPIRRLIEMRHIFQKHIPEIFKSFKERFIELYDDREMPLLEVLDAENGIPYPSNLELNDTPFFLRDLAFENIIGDMHIQETVTIFDKLLVEKLNKSKSETVIRFTWQELSLSLKGQKEPQDDTACMGLILSFLKDSPLLSASNKFEIYFKGAYGPSASNLLGRFCNIDDDLLNRTRSANRKEEELDQGRIYAEIAHLPGKRVGNIVSRPSLRDYEIPILSPPSIHQKTIPLADLTISVTRENRIVLRSKKLNREVAPRLSTAHNFVFNDLPIYRFLCDLQSQDKMEGLYFRWPESANHIRFLPRVNIDNLIVLKAKWKLFKNEIDHLLSIKSDEGLLTEFARLVDKNRIGRIVTFSEGDNQLLIDSENILCLHVLCDLIKGKDEIVLEELLENRDNLAVRDNNNLSYTNEVIIPVTIDLGRSVKVSLPRNTDINIQRSFPIGSEWLYVKIYCGSKSSDHILLFKIAPLVEDLTKRNLINSWFFIRYRDRDGYHLRLRLKGHSNFHLESIRCLYEVFSSEIKNETIRLKFGTYNRELERYGGKLISESEIFFNLDSHSVIELIQFALRIDNNIRWLIGVYAIDSLLDDFEMGIEDRMGFFKLLKTQFANEFNVNSNDKLKKQIDKRYRTDCAMMKEMHTNPQLSELSDLMKKRSLAMRCVIETTKKGLKNNEFVSENSLLSSYIHMFLNRLFESRQREHELLIYDYLFKHYQTLNFQSQNAIGAVT